MRWNCPHCGVSLAVSDEKLGAGWSFSRCYKCGGFALIRRAEVNLIKVDKAPVGENVLLPEATETPVLSQQATQNLERLLAEKPTIKPAKPRTNDTDTGIIPPAPPRNETNAAVNSFAGLPAPLPEMPEKPAYFKILPAAIGLAGILTISSGVYLYVQGQALWKSARVNAAKPASIVKQQNNADSNATQAATTGVNKNSTVTLATAENPRNDSANILLDRVQHNMMAPARNPTGSNDMNSEPLAVRIRIENTKLRSGPGTKFPVIGLADNQVRYEVLGWKGDWFKVAPIKAARAVANANEFEISAWVRNDLVEPVTASSQEQPSR